MIMDNETKRQREDEEEIINNEMGSVVNEPSTSYNWNYIYYHIE